MAHHPKPFFRKDRGLWYVQIAGRQHNLGREEVAARKLYHSLMTRPAPVAADLVAGVVDGFLDWCKANRKPRTYDGHLWHLQKFLDSLPDPGGMTVAELKPHHVQRWVDAHPSWKQTARRNAIASVQRAFLWAEKIGHIDRSPVRAVEKPQARRRDAAMSPDQFARLLGVTAEPAFRDLLVLSWETGMRPQEARHVEARHYDRGGGRLAIPPEEAKGGERWRIVLLTATAAVVVERLAAAHPDGKLLRNTEGNPWKKYAVSCLFRRLSKRLGEPVCPYLIRHGFCQRSLEAGVDHLTVAALMGHADGSMVTKIYSHMNRADKHLRDALDKANRKSDGGG